MEVETIAWVENLLAGGPTYRRMCAAWKRASRQAPGRFQVSALTRGGSRQHYFRCAHVQPAWRLAAGDEVQQAAPLLQAAPQQHNERHTSAQNIPGGLCGGTAQTTLPLQSVDPAIPLPSMPRDTGLHALTPLVHTSRLLDS